MEEKVQWDLFRHEGWVRCDKCNLWTNDLKGHKMLYHKERV